MTDYEIVYVPVGVGTFHMETAEQAFHDSCALLQRLAEQAGLADGTLKMSAGLLLSSDAVSAFLEDKHPSLVILQNVTFANAGYTEKICEKTDAPVLVWTLRDPAGDGGRLRLNALTGAFAATNKLYMDGRILYRNILGNPSEPAVEKMIAPYFQAFACRQWIEGKTFLTVGEPPEGFGFGAADAETLRKSFGLHLESLSTEEMIAMAKAVSPESAAAYAAEAAEKLPGFDALPAENQKGYAALMKAYHDYAAEHEVAALASRCWPDFFTEYGTPVCTVLSMLGDMGIPAACEGDALGAVTMLLASRLSGQPVFFGDPAALNEEDGTLTFWHCGMAAPSLACDEDGPAVGVHCNRGIGPTMEFGCRGSERVTILRIGREKDGSLRLFATGGEALERPVQYHGTSLVVKTDKPAADLVQWAVGDGWEPHFVIAMTDIMEQMRMMALLCGIGYWPY